MLFDDHMHTELSLDNRTLGVDMCRGAIDAGIQNICFTEHLDIGHPSVGDHVLDMERYSAQIASLRAQFPMLTIRMGVELGYLKSTIGRSARHIAGYPLDFVLLSQHTVYDEDPCYQSFYEGRDRGTVYRDYLLELLESLYDHTYPGYCAVAHIGFMAKFAPYRPSALLYEDFPGLIDDILKAIIENGKALEINTSGLRHGGHTLPDFNAIKRYKALGGTLVTIGSDAHLPQNIGTGLKTAVDQLRAAGFSHVVRYERMVPAAVPLNTLCYR